jgi:hypothetical protein
VRRLLSDFERTEIGCHSGEAVRHVGMKTPRSTAADPGFSRKSTPAMLYTVVRCTGSCALGCGTLTKTS